MPEYSSEVISSTSRALNATSMVSPGEKPSGHNWIVIKALKFLRRDWPTLIPQRIIEDGVHYGLRFADAPWMGLPSSINRNHRDGTNVPSVREDLYGKPAGTPVRGEDPRGDFGGVRIEWSSRSDSNPNLYLSVGWDFVPAGSVPTGILDVLTFGLLDIRTSWTGALDNISHYANDGHITVDGTWGAHGSLVWGPETGPATDRWNVSACDYAIELFKLARAFYPGSAFRPRLDALRRSATGRIVNRVGEFTNYQLGAPDTYLGSNPFVLTPDGKPTWPIWVPEQFSIEALTQNEAEQSDMASSIYLGWAMHMVQDLSVPFHAMNTSGQKHSDYENYYDSVINQDNDVLGHLPAHGDTTYRYSSLPVYWPDFLDVLDSAIGRAAYSSEERFRSSIQELIKHSKDHYNDVCDRSDRQALAAMEHLTDIALKHCIAMIVCVNQDARRARSLVGPLSLLLWAT